MTACVVLIRRFIKPERADEYAAHVARLPPVTAPGFIRKVLTRVDPALDLPPGLNSFHVAGNRDCATFVMVEHWASVDDFKAYVPRASTNDLDEFEVLPRQRVVLPAV
jgi:hypothetical protein